MSRSSQCVDAKRRTTVSGQRVSAAHEKIIGALAGHGSASPNGNRGRVPAAIPDNASDSPGSPRSPRSPRRTSPPGPAGKQWDAETPAPTQGASTPSVAAWPRRSTDSQSSDVIGSAGRSDNGLGDAGERAVVLATKLSAPAVRGQLIDRASLADRLSAEPIRKLTLVSAPAGWGKTTLLAQWVHSADDSHRFGWLTLDSPDNDPVRFWTGALTAVEKAHPGVGIHALELLASGADETQVVIPTLLNELAATDKQVVLILDDYHLIENPTVHRQVAFVLARMPATLRLVVSTRSDPPLPLARLRAGGELLEVRTDDLRFAAGEAADLLTEVVGLDLTAREVELLLRRTEGWAAGLYLAALSLDRRVDAAEFVATFAGDNRHIVDYLIAEVLAGQSAGRRSFLLRTSVLDRLNGALCDAMLEATDSAAALQEIEQENLFVVPLDLSRRWYRYHQLFAELLRAHLHFIEPELVAGLHQRAAAWFTAEGLIDDAMHHLTAVGDTARRTELIASNWIPEFNQGHLSTIAGWLDALPGETVTCDPRLSAARGWIAMNLGRIDAAGSWIEAAEAALAEHPEQADAVRPQFAVLRALHQFKTGDLVTALETAREAIGCDLPDAVMGRAGAYGIYGSAHYYLGDIGEAQAAYRQAVPLAERAGDHRVRSYALCCLAMIDAEEGRLSEAQQLINRAESSSWAFTPGEHLMGGAVSLTASAIVLAGLGDCAAASDAADMAVVAAREGGGFHETAKALMVRAQIFEHRGDHRAAEASRREAAATLQGEQVFGVAPSLLTAGETIPERDGPVAEAGEQLTIKELEVLRLMGTRLSRREIGGRLYISLNTVKTHQRAVYRKLGVDNRTAAVHRARQRGLL